MTRFPVYTDTIKFKPPVEGARIPCMRDIRAILGLGLQDALKAVTAGTLECPDEHLVDQVLDTLRQHTTEVEREKSHLTIGENGFYYCKRGEWTHEAVPTCVIFHD